MGPKRIQRRERKDRALILRLGKIQGKETVNERKKIDLF